MKAALIGYGYWGKILERYFGADSGFELAAVWSPSGAGGHRLAEPTLESLWEDREIEAVFLATPIATHRALALRALRAGKHVFCEKPLLPGTAGADELLAAAKNAGKVLYTDYIYLNSPSLAKMRELLPRIGEVRYAQGKICQFGRFSGEPVQHVLGCHLLSVMLWLFPGGCPTATSRELCRDAVRIELDVANFTADLEVSMRHIAKRRTLSVHGERGILEFDMNGEKTLRLLLFDEGNRITEQESFTFDESNNLRRALQHFADVIAGREPNNLNLSLQVSRLLASC